MKKKPGKYLKFYYKAIKSGRMPTDGLCRAFDLTPEGCYFTLPRHLGLFEPTMPGATYWGSGDETEGTYEQYFTFTPLRQTIVLFCAAMNNEL